MDHDDDDDDDASRPIPSGPIIIPLLQEEPTPRGTAIFNVIAADISSEYKAKARLCCLRICSCCCGSNTQALVEKNENDEEIGNSSNNKNEYYKKARNEFIIFVCCYGFVAIVGMTVAFNVYLMPYLRTSTDWYSVQEKPNYHYNKTATMMAVTTDDDDENYEGKDFFQKMNHFFFGDIGFADDDDY